MGRIKVILFFCAALLIIVAGCSRGGTLVEDPHNILGFSDSTAPIVELSTPTDSQVFNNGDIIKVDGKVTDNSLYRGSIRITNDATGSIIKEQLYEIHGYQLYNFHFEYKTAVTSIANYTVTVQFEDHGLNADVKTAKVKVNP